MSVDRRSLLTGGALLALASASSRRGKTAPPQSRSTTTSKNAAVYVPGYFPESAFANGKPLADNRRFNRAIKGQPVHKMLTRVGFDGSIRQTLLPVAAHDVEVAPDRSIGVLCSMDGEQHTAFDPETLELAAIGPSLGDGWHGGGHAVYLDGGRTVILSERAPSTPYSGQAGQALRPADRARSEDAEDRRDLLDARHRPARHQADGRRQIHRGGQLRLDHLGQDGEIHHSARRRAGVDHRRRGVERQAGRQARHRQGRGRTAPPRGRPARPHLRDPGALRQRPRRCAAAQGRKRRLRERYHHRPRLQLHGGGDAEIRRGAQPAHQDGRREIDQADAARPVDPLRRAPRRGDRHLSEHASRHGVRRRDRGGVEAASTRARSACAIPPA